MSEAIMVLGKALGAALCMGIGRTVYGIYGEKINIEKALLFCSVFTVLCYLTIAFVPSAGIALLGCALCGFGVSLMWPGMLSYTSQKYNYKAGPVLFSLLALGGDLGCSVGPWLTGKVSDVYLNRLTEVTAAAESQAIRYGLLAAAVFCLLEGDAGLSLRHTFYAVIPMLIYGAAYLLNILINGKGSGIHTNDWYGFTRWGMAASPLVYLVMASITWGNIS